ncbi:MAG: Lon-like protease [Actinomycetota bacterium]|nr:Lon-like protease [Actinomycetota bacterium]
MSPWLVAVLVFSVLTAALGVSARFVSLPYDSLGPGTARAVNSVVSVKGHPSYPPRGQLLYTTVSVRERVNPYEALAGWLDPEVDVIPEQKVRGDTPADIFRQQNVEAMADSKTTAELLALRHLGFTDLGGGAEIVSVDPAMPAAPLLRPEDVIVEVDGQPVSTSDEAGTAIRAHKPGDTVRLRILREGSGPLDLEAPLGEGEEGRALLGVRLTTKVKLPFEITIDSGKVTGPSAGLAYALELLDVLTPGELTGGVPVAVTGDLQPDGTVGAIGGVAQKAATVRRAGAKVFLVPNDNLVEAKAHAGGKLDVRGVGSFDEALRVLGSLDGSNALALGQPGAAT